MIDLKSLKTSATIDRPQQSAGIAYWKIEALPLSTTGLATSTYGFRRIAPKSSRAQSQLAANPGEKEEMSAKLPGEGENGFRLVVLFGCKSFCFSVPFLVPGMLRHDSLAVISGR